MTITRLRLRQKEANRACTANSTILTILVSFTQATMLVQTNQQQMTQLLDSLQERDRERQRDTTRTHYLFSTIYSYIVFPILNSRI